MEKLIEECRLPGYEFMGDLVRNKLKRCDDGVKIYPLAKLCKPEVIELKNFCRIRDFSFIWGGQGVVIGEYSDIQPHVVVWGGGDLKIGDYVSVGVGTVILTATYDYRAPKMVDGLPNETKTLFGTVIIEDNCYIGAHCTIMPNVKIAEGSVIGANSLVLKDTEPFGIYVGSPCKKIGNRPKGEK